MLSRWVLTEEERDTYINALKDQLAVLREKAGVSQVELCNIIGVSRQTYSAIETGRKKMMWPTYLSLVYFFDSIAETREMLRGLPAYPKELIYRINEGKDPDAVLFGQAELNEILKELDDQARHSLRTMMLVEYARCKKLSGDVVIKAFDGIDLLSTPPEAATELALHHIKNKTS